MKAAVWLALAALPALSQAGGGQVAPFAVYTEFQREPSKLVLNSLQQELNSIMSGANWRMEWRSLASRPNGEAFTELAIVTFKGSCDVSSVVVERVETGALGWTHVMNGDVLPYSEINCEFIRSFLSRSLVDLWPHDRDVVFGRALARVLAHELYHVSTRTRHHGSWGVAEAAFTVRELMADEFSFSQEDQHALNLLRLSERPEDAAKSRELGKSVFAGNGCVSCHGEKAKGTVVAPPLRQSARSLNASKLTSKLAAKASEMYRRAQDQKITWHLDRSDIENLLLYLGSPAE